jgi:hypothetical protein
MLGQTSVEAPAHGLGSLRQPAHDQDHCADPPQAEVEGVESWYTMECIATKLFVEELDTLIATIATTDPIEGAA